MGVTAIVGANWGDEGKGKITDFLAAEADVVVRYQGGSNAGHTIINSYGKFALHLLPSGVFYPHITNVLGPGTAVNIAALMQEWQALLARDVPAPRLLISERAQVVMPYHPQFDALEEERLGSRSFGSTKAGIAPFYADKYAKIGIQIADLFEEDRLRARLEGALSTKNVLMQHLYGKPALQVEELVATLREQAEAVRPFVADTTTFLQDAWRAGRRILLEGQLGALRDPDHGIYPFSTSSSTLAGFATVGAGLPPYALDRVVAVVKAYSSCVGAGPFVSEIFGDAAHELRERGGDKGEYGATTGRPRRMGWFDVVATRYGCRVQGATEVALSLLDVLGYLDEIPVCVEYEVDGERTGAFPTTGKLERARPVLETLPGWKCDITTARRWDELPAEARSYVEKVEAWIGVPVRWVSVAPGRDAIIRR